MGSYFQKYIKDSLIIVSAVVLITILIWLPHILRVDNLFGLNFSNGFSTIYRNFDGLEYIVIAKTLYNPSLIAGIPQHLPDIYFASHFPLYALVILLFAPILGFLKSMLFVSVLFTCLSAVGFYFLVRDFKLSQNPLFLSLVFLILPARWLVVHSIGSSEPLFIFLVLITFYCFLKFEENSKWLWIHLAAFFGLLAQLTRPPGILLFIGLITYILFKSFSLRPGNVKDFFKLVIKYYPLILIPIGLVTVFAWYGNSFNDFFAYFHSGDNIHLTFPPFQVFNKHQFWVGDIWLEDLVYIFILGFLGVFMLFKQRLYSMGIFVLVYLVAASMVVHRDISRYVLPIAPFVLIAFQKVLITKEFKIILIILTLAVYLYSQNYLIENVAPVSDLSVFN